MEKMSRKKAAKEPYEGYTLPRSAEKGGQFVDFNEPYRSKVPVKKVLKIKRKENGKKKVS